MARRRHAGLAVFGVVSLNPFALSLSEGCFFLVTAGKEEVQCFDKLSTNGSC
jgi:hypothetical protein